MISIRRNTFETNSSSTHAICITTQDLYKRWQGGDKSVILCYYNSTYTLVELKDINKYYDSIGIREQYDNYLKVTKRTQSFEEYVELMMEKYSSDDFDDSYSEYCEWFEKPFTTPNGEQVIAFGYFGYDG